jgi:hydroxymethylbilane synthase
LLAPLSHPDTKILVTAERGVMLAINGNCTTPVAAFGLRQGDSLFLRAFLAEPDGSRPRSVETTLPFPENAEAAAEIGRKLGAQLL